MDQKEKQLLVSDCDKCISAESTRKLINRGGNDSLNIFCTDTLYYASKILRRPNYYGCVYVLWPFSCLKWIHLF